MNSLKRRRARKGQLLATLKLAEDEDFEALLARALFVARTINPDREVAFLMYYGLRGHVPSTLDDIKEVLNLNPGRIRIQVRAVEDLLPEILRTMRRERVAPGSYGSWPLDEFFTMERGVRAHIDFRMTTRVCNAVKDEHARTTTVYEFCEQTDRDLLRIPLLGPEALAALKTMLDTVGLSLAHERAA